LDRCISSETIAIRLMAALKLDADLPVFDPSLTFSMFTGKLLKVSNPILLTMAASELSVAGWILSVASISDRS